MKKIADFGSFCAQFNLLVNFNFNFSVFKLKIYMSIDKEKNNTNIVFQSKFKLCSHKKNLAYRLFRYFICL